METDLQMRGKVAQFGRGAMEKISQRMFESSRGTSSGRSRAAGLRRTRPRRRDGAAGADAAATPGSEPAEREQRGRPALPSPGRRPTTARRWTR